ncbi:DUF3553 domain-containing protein [Crateriforma conspicua]|uniref:DUF3553 domain-containing protein n=1 Tax=Crateriforma conspicua TaxID=2527996 RepID=UPI0018CDEDEA
MNSHVAPRHFSVGDRLVDPERPKWGTGVVVRDSSAARSPTVGQRLDVEWEHRGLTTVLTATRNLKPLDA